MDRNKIVETVRGMGKRRFEVPLVVSALPLKFTFARKHTARYAGYTKKPFVMKKLINLRSMFF